MLNKVISKHDFAGVVLAEHYNLSETLFENCDLRGAIFPASLDEMQGIKLNSCILDNNTLRDILAKCGDDYRACVGVICQNDESVIVNFFRLIKRIYPQEDLIGYKALWNDERNDYVLATLRIRRDVPSVIFPGSKCRAASAEVLSICDASGNAYKTGHSCFNFLHGAKFVYTVGSEVVADSFDSHDVEVCTNGIHFFLCEEGVWSFIGSQRIIKR